MWQSKWAAALTDFAAGPVEVIRSDLLSGVPHGFLGRKGGVSTGIVAGLNVGFGADDDLEAVQENRRRAVEAVKPGSRLVTVHQIHSSDAVIVAEPWDESARPHADALVTDQPGLLLGIVTADCAPILLADCNAGVVAAAHAGWRGAHGGVIEATIVQMEALGADSGSIAAAIGPAIGPASYEVGEDFGAAFNDNESQFFAPGQPGHLQFDLPAYVLYRLEKAGISKVQALDLDTYPDAGRFFSYRRSTHCAEPNYGRQFSLIGLPD
jgi:YfiH family protein